MILLRWLIGSALRRVRHEQGRTLRHVAKAAGVSTGYLSEIERGRKEASSEVLAALCAALRIDLTDLLGLVHDQMAGPAPATSRTTTLPNDLTRSRALSLSASRHSSVGGTVRAVQTPAVRVSLAA